MPSEVELAFHQFDRFGSGKMELDVRMTSNALTILSTFFFLLVFCDGVTKSTSGVYHGRMKPPRTRLMLMDAHLEDALCSLECVETESVELTSSSSHFISLLSW